MSGYNYSVRAVSPIGTAVQIESPYLHNAATAPAGQEMATVTIELTNAMPDRAVPLTINTAGDSSGFTFAVRSEDSAGLPDVWQGDCNVKPAPTTASHGFCIDLATRIQSTEPSHVDEVEPQVQIPAGSTLTIHLYSTPFPTTLSLEKLALLFTDFTGAQTRIPLPHA